MSSRTGSCMAASAPVGYRTRRTLASCVGVTARVTGTAWAVAYVNTYWAVAGLCGVLWAPHSRPPTSSHKSGAADYLQKNPRPFWPLLATPGREQTISGAAAMTVPSSIGTGTPAPAIRLPLDPAPTHPRERPFRRNRACDLIFKRDRQKCGDGASPKRPVCHSHSCHPQLHTERVMCTNSSHPYPSRLRCLSHRSRL